MRPVGSKTKTNANKKIIKEVLDMDYEPPSNAVRNNRLLQNLGLPGDLVNLISAGTLVSAIEEAYEKIDRLNTMLDEFEEREPEISALLPWHDAREAWKAEGRPRAEWYEIMNWSNRRARQRPITPRDIDFQLTHETVAPTRVKRRMPLDQGGRPWLYGKTRPKG